MQFHPLKKESCHTCTQKLLELSKPAISWKPQHFWTSHPFCFDSLHHKALWQLTTGSGARHTTTAYMYMHVIHAPCLLHDVTLRWDNISPLSYSAASTPTTERVSDKSSRCWLAITVWYLLFKFRGLYRHLLYIHVHVQCIKSNAVMYLPCLYSIYGTQS